ncbi:lignin-forming anionic peroxidase-like [Musa troglodytarum]|uniref:Peroxidase n=1 Tax=Musa troglodytarum TaxID=320322 RepID=A0A9E7JW25_9LILI|nr:lignin-forming anionic peroxidase-like [Musa troglodytarum]
MSRSVVSRFNIASMLLFLATMSCEAHLTPIYYANSCPHALSTIRTAVRSAIARERRMAASIIRLHFHDCFVQRAKARQNFQSARGFEVIDSIKAAVEEVCPGVVSCADILAVAARDSSVYAGGPTWTVKLGRRDSTTANKDLAEQNLPIATVDDLDKLISLFDRQGLSVKDMCATFRGRIYNETNIDSGFAKTRGRRCPSSPVLGNNTLAPLDLVTPNSFDNNYYKNLLTKKGLLHSDQVLFNGGPTDDIVRLYSKDQAAFLSDFADAMVKMGDISPLIGSAGEVRKICSVTN